MCLYSTKMCFIIVYKISCYKGKFIPQNVYFIWWRQKKVCRIGHINEAFTISSLLDQEHHTLNSHTLGHVRNKNRLEAFKTECEKGHMKGKADLSWIKRYFCNKTFLVLSIVETWETTRLNDTKTIYFLSNPIRNRVIFWIKHAAPIYSLPSLDHGRIKNILPRFNKC